MPRRARWSRNDVRAIAARQHGLITAAQLAELGVPRSTVAWQEGQVGGMFSFVLPGVHQVEPTQGLTPLQGLVAAQLYAGPDSVLTGAALLRYREVKAARHPSFGSEGAVHVLVEHGSRRASSGFVVVERTRSLPPAREDGLLRLAPVHRATVDACRRCTDEAAVRALVLEVVQRRLTSPDALNDERVKGQKRGSRFVRLALEPVYAGARSVPEAELVPALRAAGLGRMLLNPRLRTADGAFLACPDAYDPLTGVALEVDSREHHFDTESWEATMRRHARMTAAGLRVIHVPPSRLRREPDAVFAEVWAAIHAAAGQPSPAVTVLPAA